MDMIYKFINKEGVVIYVGQTKNIKERLMSHLRSNFICEECYKNIEIVEYSVVNELYNPLYVERYFITKYTPIYNKKDYMKDFKKNIEFESMEWETIIYKDFLVDMLLGKKNKKKERNHELNNSSDLAFSKEIEEIIEEKGLKKKWVAECLGITYNSLRRKLIGEVEWKKNEKQAILNILKGE